MDLYKLSLRDDALPRERKTSVFDGPFVVAAMNSDAARHLVGLNCDTIVERTPGADHPVAIWYKDGGSDCDRLAPFDEDRIRQRHIVAGTDVAPWYLSELQLTDARGELAHMVWWPVKPNDQCPV